MTSTPDQKRALEWAKEVVAMGRSDIPALVDFCRAHIDLHTRAEQAAAEVENALEWLGAAFSVICDYVDIEKLGEPEDIVRRYVMSAREQKEHDGDCTNQCHTCFVAKYIDGLLVDECASCGLDLRDSVHAREARAALNGGEHEHS